MLISILVLCSTNTRHLALLPGKQDPTAQQLAHIVCLNGCIEKQEVELHVLAHLVTRELSMVINIVKSCECARLSGLTLKSNSSKYLVLILSRQLGK